MPMLTTASRVAKEIQIVSQILPPRQFQQWLSGIPIHLPTLLSTKSLGALDHEFGTSFIVRWQDRQLQFDNLGFGVVREIYGHRCYAEPGQLKNAKQILDLGANAGAFTVFALAEAPQAQVHAVEAQAHFAQILQHNVQKNGYSNRLTVETAVVGGFYNIWTQELQQQDPHLDKFDIRRYIERVKTCDFLKCDVEGGEFKLFEGDLTWTQAVQTMVIEYHPEWGSVSELEDRLKSQNFQVRKAAHGYLGYFYCTRA